MKTPLFFKPGRLVRILKGIHKDTIGVIADIYLDRYFAPLITVKFINLITCRTVKVTYLRGELELLPSHSDSIVSYIRMSTAA